ncbi:MAG: cytochrome C [Thermodesulfovibrionales bacterium]|jgi:nitrate/TMAO reductase-like tetraheme cytochrome c subunit
MRYVFLVLVVVLFTLPSITSGSYREEFEKEFLSEPWGGEQTEVDVCIECHSSDKMKPSFRNIVDEWNTSWHAQNKISCHDCHGGDPTDAAVAMSPQRGFLGAPKYDQVPEFCGKCHVGILKYYLESGHGKALKATGNGPNCVTCHGAHNIQKASIDIINEQRCTKCHSYERAKIMKQALFVTEEKISNLESSLKRLKAQGVFAEDEEKSLFSTEAEFRTLFHTVDVSLVKERTDDFTRKLNAVEKGIQETFLELDFRKNFSAFLMLLFAGMGIVIFLLSKTPRE